jgi:hypothetical protein
MTEEKENYGIPAKELKIDIDTSSIKAEMKTLCDAENRIRELEKQAEENKQYKDYFDSHSGTGTLPANLNHDEGNQGGSGVPSGAHEFDSFEEMVEWCRLNNRVAYRELKKKSANAMANHPQSFEWKDTFDEDGNSLIGRTLYRANSQKRSKQK